MFQVGDKVVHPMHGAGESMASCAKRSVERQWNSYVSKMPISGLTLKIPIENSAAIGVRAIKRAWTRSKRSSRIPKLGIDMTSNWNHRYRENMDRLESGDLDEVSAVIKALMHRDSTRGLSNGERARCCILPSRYWSLRCVLAEDVEYPCGREPRQRRDAFKGERVRAWAF